MTINVDVNFPPNDTIIRYLRAIYKEMRKMAQTMDELAADLTALTAVSEATNAAVQKIGGETTAILATIEELEAALAAGGMTSPAVDAALAALKVSAANLSAQVTAVDDLVPDAA